MVVEKFQTFLPNETHSRVLNSDIQKVSNGKKELSSDEKIKVKEAAKGFESLFMYLILKEMRKAMLDSLKSEEQKMDLGGDILGDLGYMELTNQLAKLGSGIGIANLIYKQLTGEDMEKRVEIQKPRETNYKSINLKKTNTYSKLSTDEQLAFNKTQTKQGRLGNYEEYIFEAAEKYRLEPELIKSVILAESNANQFAVSKAGAKGLMQLVDSTARYLGVDNPFEPRQNILSGSRYLRELLDTFDGNLDLALAAYNAGPGSVYKYNGIPPFPETRAYVQRVKKIYQTISSNNSFGLR
ncbi:MAG: transglycosylase SLT domain-containing protein [Candidatus Kapaibacteriales bacterium]